MTLEELKQLKRGDEIFIRAKYKKVCSDGDVCFSLFVTSVFGEVAKGEGHTLPKNVILPSELQTEPKYDPCRLFKKGDKVRVKNWNGRTTLRAGQFGFVVANEAANGMVELAIDGWENDIFYHACLLELVTPVEEMEPYIVKKYHEFYAVERRNNHKDRPATYDVDFHPHAKEAAEAKCARLNAEYRKEQR